MKEIAKFNIWGGHSSFFRPTLKEEAFEECVKRWPKFPQGGGPNLKIEVEYDSPIFHEIVQFIRESSGQEPYLKRFPSLPREEKDQYQIRGERKFTKSELDEATHLLAFPVNYISKYTARLPNGQIQLARRDIKSKPLGKSMTIGTCLCTDTVKNEMEAEGFKNLSFTEVDVKGKLPPKEPLWEIGGEQALPKVLNPLVNEEGKTPDHSVNGCWVDDIFFPPLLEFNESEVVARLGEFDVASTSERWCSGTFEKRSPFLICSQRFRQWCTSRKYKMNYFPVSLK
ncbi:hypothetical protein [Persicirhabdus sediminis]|uniref:Uncharacterized protein n=1 Tax=Persicirhabdus sediminis TaxID=454144 RepID=A0A8J7MGV9_9BACT|nr:hypothetical protein [Persicirhabdus sediminis]MBK1791599.1 hypothetical protein [Persicirhabdus sediminis]